MLLEAFEPAVLVTFAGGVNWSVGFLTTISIFAILALGLNVQWGYGGVFNFGVVAFFMVGAYVSALLTIGEPRSFESYIGGFDLPVIVGWFGGAAAGGVLALIVGLPTLRLRADFLAIATIGVAAILRSVANSVDGLVNRGSGLRGIPRFMGGLVEGGNERWVLLATTLLALAVVYAVVSRVTASPWGRVLRGIRENEDTVRASGKDTVNFRMQSFVLGGVIMGLAGAIWAHRFGSIAPNSFSDLFGTFLVWTMLMVGGSGNNRGVLLGAVVVGLFWFGTPLIQEDLPDVLGARVFMLRQLAVGLLIVLALLWRPQGLLAEELRVSRYIEGFERSRGGSLLDRLRRRAPGREPGPRGA